MLLGPPPAPRHPQPLPSSGLCLEPCSTLPTSYLQRQEHGAPSLSLASTGRGEAPTLCTSSGFCGRSKIPPEGLPSPFFRPHSPSEHLPMSAVTSSMGLCVCLPLQRVSMKKGPAFVTDSLHPAPLPPPVFMAGQACAKCIQRSAE